MRSPGGTFAALVGGTLLVSLVFATLAASFVRETSGIQERWGNRSATEREGIENAFAQIAVASNISDSGGRTVTGGDHDGDGIPDDIDADPTNPDTDGDGTDDGIETVDGTDPTDPTKGGVPTVVVTPTPQRPIDRLFISGLSKVVRNQDGTWKHFARVSVGATVEFRIQADLINQGGDHTAVIEDRLPGALEFVSGTAELDTATIELKETDLASFRYRMTAPGSYRVVLLVKARITSPGTFENIVTAYEVAHPTNRLIDKAFVTSESPSSESDIPTPPPCQLCNFYKVGRVAESNRPWSRIITTTGNSPIEFRIVAELAGTVGTTVLDTLPAEMSYQPGSMTVMLNNARLEVDETALFGPGLYFPANDALSQLEITFRANPYPASTFELTNTASAHLDGQSTDNDRTAQAIVISH
jgi:hypothetical protein